MADNPPDNLTEQQQADIAKIQEIGARMANKTKYPRCKVCQQDGVFYLGICPRCTEPDFTPKQDVADPSAERKDIGG